MAGENKRYYWLKLKDDFFRQKEIKQLRKIAGGDTFVIIYLKMLLRSVGEDGQLYFEGYEDTFVSELALDIDEDVENVKVTVAYLMAKGILIQSSEEEYKLLSAAEMTGSETASTRRSRKSRARLLGCVEKALQCNADATKCNTEKEIEKREKREEIEREIEQEFEKFWSVYPRKDGKQDALKAWKSLNPNHDLQDTIIKDVQRRMREGGAWFNTEKRFIKTAAPYLRGRRWEDETETPRRIEGDHLPFTQPPSVSPDERKAMHEALRNGTFFQKYKG